MQRNWPTCWRRSVTCAFLISVIAWRSALSDSSDFRANIVPILRTYCFDCHAGETTEADIDFGMLSSIEDARQQLPLFMKTRRILDSGQMPPKDSPQLPDDVQRDLQTWVHDFLKREAETSAGDPGEVVLRRLNNDEYNYTVRDLTGVFLLNPTREFPIDGAAGEGFINTGAAQSMSPAMVTKFLEAGKDVAAHMVLTPEGIEFSEGISRSAWVNERLNAIRDFYDRYTVPQEVFVEVGGTGKVSNEGGAIPLDRYFLATLEEREELSSNKKSIATVAIERKLNIKYLETLWNSLTTPNAKSSVLLDELRQLWLQTSPADVEKLTQHVEQWQAELWRFDSIGQLTEGGKQKVWMSPLSPIVTRQEFRVPLTAKSSTNGQAVPVFLSANDLGDGGKQDNVVWLRPRLEYSGDASSQPSILLRDVPGIVERTRAFVLEEVPRTSLYLDAVASIHTGDQSPEQAASTRGLNISLLERWGDLTDLWHESATRIVGHFKDRVERVQGYQDVNGWGPPQTPNMLTNRSNDDISFSTLTVPGRGVVVHPSPTQESIVAWKSPVSAAVMASVRVADADDKCGNGAAWRVQVQSRTGTAVIGQGTFENGQESHFQTEEKIHVQPGDVISLIVNARDKSHVCDTTHVELTLTEVAGDARKWDLANEVVDRILESNPLPDSYGNADTWHFCASDISSSRAESLLIPESMLAHWRAAVVEERPLDEVSRLAKSVQRVLETQEADTLSESDRKLHDQFKSWTGPMRWVQVNANSGGTHSSNNWQVTDLEYGFGKHPDGTDIDEASLCIRASEVVRVNIPVELIRGAELVTTAQLHEASQAGSVAVRVLDSDASLDHSLSFPLLVSQHPEARARIESSFTEFRNLFPSVVCYSRIVPVDEVVTLTLYFREDHHLQRLMLTEAEIAELNGLWEELLFVAQEPIGLSVAFEQIYEFATQDRPDLVKAFEPMREPINARADQFRQRLVDLQPVHVKAVLEFADKAWRRPLSDGEQRNLRDLYDRLRAAEIGHEQAVRLLLTRILTSPAFLYRNENSLAEHEVHPVSSHELASRLSYFLWSSVPDAELRRAADAGHLLNDDELLQQTRRMLQDSRTRRLAVQFACQWLHVRNFDRNDDKNEKLYPEFAELRGDMYEETVRFFEDMFRHNGSILNVLNANHSFLNKRLAQHYGIEGVHGAEWQRVENMRHHGRGGVFGMGTILASQSGASRTSPILRGNWTYETLLGERLPRPPANVPQLPENVPAGLTARELIEQHSSVEACAGCHKKIDPYGFALEGFDAIGRKRSNMADTRTTLEDGHVIDGLSGLRDYLLTQRRDDVVRQFCRKLLGYALGREVQLSDEVLLDQLQKELASDEYQFGIAVEKIVLSQQFRSIRGLKFPGSGIQAGENR